MGKVRYKNTLSKFEILSSKPNEITELKSSIRGSGIEEVFQLNTDRIKIFDKQARYRFDEKELKGLIASIQEVGIINPLLVMKDSELGWFKVINGERRLRAVKEIGLKKVPCIILKDENKSELIAIIDNIQRADLHPLELASAYQSLVSNYGDKKLISQKIGVGYTSFLETMKLNTLPEKIKIHLLDNNLRSRAIFRQLLKSSNIDEMRKLLGLVEVKNLKIKKTKIFEAFLKNNDIVVEFSDKQMTLEYLNILNSKLQEIIQNFKNKH